MDLPDPLTVGGMFQYVIALLVLSAAFFGVVLYLGLGPF